MDSKRKTKLPIRSLPPTAEWLLRHCQGDQLSFLEKIATNSSDYKALLEIIRKLQNYNTHQVFVYKAKDAQDLSEFRAGMVGEVTGLDALLYAVEGAKLEIVRRKKDKNV